MTRLRALDGLRGIAALAVVLHHAALALPGVRERLAGAGPLALLVAGPQAVLVFFVLSGFVLFEAWHAQVVPSYIGWCVRRSVRLLVPMAASVVTSAALVLVLHPHAVSGASEWLNTESWSGARGWAPLARNLLPLDQRANHQLNNVTWSLVHEWRVSLMLPLIALSVALRPWLSLALALLVLPWTTDYPARSVDLAWTAHYAWAFVAGSVIARYRDRLTRLLDIRAGQVAGILLVVATLAMMAADAGTLPTFGSGVAAIVLVGVAAGHRGLAVVLEACVPQWLGELSFSLYLVHLPVMLTLIHAGDAFLPLPVLVVMSPPMALAAAIPFHRWVERPSRRFAGILGRKAQAGADRIVGSFVPERTAMPGWWSGRRALVPASTAHERPCHRIARSNRVCR